MSRSIKVKCLDKTWPTWLIRWLVVRACKSANVKQLVWKQGSGGLDATRRRLYREQSIMEKLSYQGGNTINNSAIAKLAQ